MTHDEYQNRLRRNVTLLQWHNIFVSMVFVLPVLVPLYHDRGLGFREFMIGEAVFSAVMIAMEVPSGWLSDVWKRRSVLALACLTHVMGWTTLWLADGFLMTVVAQGMLGIGVSLISGTNSALLYDSMFDAGMADEYRRYEGKRHAVGLYAVAAASVAGGFLYHAHPDLPVLLTIAACFVGFAMALMMQEPHRHRVPVQKHPVADMIDTVRFAIHGHREIAGIMILSAVLFSATKMLMWSQQPYYIMLGLPEMWFGALAAIGFLMGGLGGHFGHLVDGRFRNVPTLAVFMGVMVMLAGTAALWPGYHAIPLLLMGSTIFGFAWPRVQAAVNNRVDGSRRATILSSVNMAVFMVAIPLFVVMGWADDHGGVTLALKILAAVVATGMVAGLLLIRHINTKTEKAA